MDFILASGSPRRSEILSGLGLDFKVYKSDAEDSYDRKNEAPCDYAMNLSRLKATDVAKRVEKLNDTLIIGADTIVVKDNDILGKPTNINDAESMLRGLSGKVHKVITGVTVIHMPTKKIVSGFEETKVYFKEISDAEIKGYLKHKEYADKAGAYGIQGLGALFVKSIEGCYFNVVGLPVYKLNELLETFGFNILAC